MLALIPEKELHLESLKIYIKRYIATSDIVVAETLRTMQDMGFIQETSTPFKYKLFRNGTEYRRL